MHLTNPKTSHGALIRITTNSFIHVKARLCLNKPFKSQSYKYITTFSNEICTIKLIIIYIKYNICFPYQFNGEYYLSYIEIWESATTSYKKKKIMHFNQFGQANVDPWYKKNANLIFFFSSHHIWFWFWLDSHRSLKNVSWGLRYKIKPL